ncbi:hypothetical protein Rhopal_002890-T1 [Rhodotorula paludigena]|uniref:Uncharacterized protein n=1 Tax=Rhodotorula paludigena TaxID=86838 RepID=A0AAV5GBR5_9BASI|nr:hypothetical protein Rhopal_002890-T1 [Rhodotorula paludigena]
MSRAHARHGFGHGTEFPGISAESNAFVGADVALSYMQQHGEQGFGLESSTALGVWAYIHHEQAPLAHALARVRVSSPDQTWNLMLIRTNNHVHTSAIDSPARHETFTIPVERDDGTFAVPRGMRLFRVDALVRTSPIRHPTVHVAKLGRLATGLARNLHNIVKPEDEHETVDDNALFASLIRIIAWYDLVQHVDAGDSHAETWLEGAERFEAGYYADMRRAVRELYETEEHRVRSAVERLYDHPDFDRHHWEAESWNEDRMVMYAAHALHQLYALLDHRHPDGEPLHRGGPPPFAQHPRSLGHTDRKEAFCPVPRWQ